MEGALSVRRKRESRKRKFSTRMRSPTHWGGRSMPGDHAPPQGGAMGAVLGVLLRNYGFTDLPPSLPLPRSDPVTRTSESSYRRGCAVIHFLFKANEKSNDATQAKRKHDARPEPASHRRTCTLSRARARARLDLSAVSALTLSFSFHARDSRDRRAGTAGSSAATRHPAAAAGGVRCHRTAVRTPRRAPRPRDRTASERGKSAGPYGRCR
jgi:hypothetical protein